jgi:hypothetical protein
MTDDELMQLLEGGRAWLRVHGFRQLKGRIPATWWEKPMHHLEMEEPEIDELKACMGEGKLHDIWTCFVDMDSTGSEYVYGHGDDPEDALRHALAVYDAELAHMHKVRFGDFIKEWNNKE